MKFNVGDKVRWTSQAGSYSKTKEGVVVIVIPENNFVDHWIPYGFKVDGALGRRKHESYLVRIGKRTNLNWPRVVHLEKI